MKFRTLILMTVLLMPGLAQAQSNPIVGLCDSVVEYGNQGWQITYSCELAFATDADGGPNGPNLYSACIESNMPAPNIFGFLVDNWQPVSAWVDGLGSDGGMWWDEVNGLKGWRLFASQTETETRIKVRWKQKPWVGNPIPVWQVHGVSDEQTHYHD